MSGVAAEVWFRNPEYYIKEIIEIGEHRLAFDRGYLVKRRLDPSKWASLFFGADAYRILAIGDQGTAEVDESHTLAAPKAVYPTWRYGEDFDALEDLVQKPAGANEEWCNDLSIPADERPVLGQEHRVVITDLPVATSGPGRRILRLLHELQQDYFDCIIHIHGLYSFRALFAHEYGAVDVEPRILAKKGKVTLGSGKEITYEQAARLPQWVGLNGMHAADLMVPRNRCIFNMKSALWAAENFRENVTFKSRAGYHPVDPDNPVALAPTTGAVRTSSRPILSTDKITCDTCSLANHCKYFRVGEVCSVPDSEMSALARMFKTRDADQIIDGLTNVLAVQADRLSRGVEDEEEYGELDPEVTKIVNSLMTHGNKLAKLINPALNQPQVGVFVGAGGQAAVVPDPKQVTANIVRELEAQGIPRNKITPDMVLRVLSGGAEQQSIEVQSQAG